MFVDRLIENVIRRAVRANLIASHWSRKHWNRWPKIYVRRPTSLHLRVWSASRRSATCRCGIRVVPNSRVNYVASRRLKMLIEINCTINCVINCVFSEVIQQQQELGSKMAASLKNCRRTVSLQSCSTFWLPEDENSAIISYHAS